MMYPDHKHLIVKRGHCGLTVDKLSERSGVSVQTILEIEAGEEQNPTLTTLRKLCHALRIPLEDLCPGQSKMKYKIGSIIVRDYLDGFPQSGWDHILRVVENLEKKSSPRE